MMKPSTTHGWQRLMPDVSRGRYDRAFGLMTSLDTERLPIQFSSPSPSTLGHQEVEALTRYLRLLMNMPNLQHMHSPYNLQNSNTVVRPQVDRFNTVSTARKTFRPALINGRPPNDPLSSIQCPEALFEIRMSKHIMLQCQRERGKAGVILQLFRHRFSHANGRIRVGQYALVRCFEPLPGPDLYGGEE